MTPVKGYYARSAAFEDAGLFFMRSKRIYLVALCQPVGCRGTGPHKHNDWLSFEMAVDSLPAVVDPGTYCYTGDLTSRRLFRSTAFHNTVMVDGSEQIPLENAMFALPAHNGRARVLSWESNGDGDNLVAEHTGYMRLESPLLHRRTFALDKRTDIVEIEDIFKGERAHRMEFNLHLARDVRVTITGPEWMLWHGDHPLLRGAAQGWLPPKEEEQGWISAAYNRRETAAVLRLTSDTSVDTPRRITLCPALDQDSR